MKRNLRKALSLVLCAVLLFAVLGINCLAATVTDGENTYIAGDANTDNSVDIRDMVRIKRYIADSNTEICIIAADANGDQAVNAADLTVMRKNLLGVDDSLSDGGTFWTTVY